MPVDEAPREPSLVAYRAALLAAVRARDVERVIALSDPDIRTSFGDDGGSAQLRRRLARPELWEDLEHLLTMGGTFRGEAIERSFWAPYVYSAWPDGYDAFTHVAVIAAEVPLRASQEADARAIALLSYDIVERPGGRGGNVRTADGRDGWVDPKHLRSPIGYRAGFARRGESWRMTALVAGD